MKKDEGSRAMRHMTRVRHLIAVIGWRATMNPKRPASLPGKVSSEKGNFQLKIVKANQEHIKEVARLFDLYRQFYECEPDLALATQFISDRTSRGESDIFVALNADKASGFVQLYPSFCSVDAVKIYILYDLYVDADSRKTGLGEKLMNTATDWAESNGAARLDLLTADDNLAGQHLYEKLGYKKVLQDFYAYSLSV